MTKITESRLPLCDADLANLRASGLTDGTIRMAKIRTEAGAMVFPYFDYDGTVNCYAVRRPHIPTMKKEGKPAKYLNPPGEPLRAYFPPASLTKLRDGASPVFMTEGVKKALALSQLGLAAVGLAGIWCGCKPQTTEQRDDLTRIPLTDLTVHIVFDWDPKPTTRRDVDAARRRLAAALRKAGAKEVYAVKLPPGPNGSKQGVDDFLMSHGAAAFQELVQQAEPVSDSSVAPLDMPSGRTDAANARRLVAKHGGEIRWVGHWDKWLIWDGRRWAGDKQLRIELVAKEIAAALWQEISRYVAAGNPDKMTLGYMVAWAKSSNSAGGIRAMVALARSEAGIPIGPDELDCDPLALNVENGTIDLATGKLREHRKEDYLTKLAPVTFDAAADCPTWRAFLDRIFAGDANLTGYTQRLVGYSMTGLTQEHVLPFLHGNGANGKSTKVETIIKLLGPDYAMKAPPDLLMAKRGESHPTERADLFGKRLVACVETEAGRRLAESLVKELTGGDRVRARRMREDFWEFAPTHHVWLVSNHKPAVIGTDHGIWRRIKLIPFDVVIPDAEQDKQLPTKLEAELPGILNWAIAGCLEWQKSGLREPDIVKAATGGYQTEMDDVGQFIDEHCERGPDFVEPATELYRAYLAANPGCGMTQKEFGNGLGRKGFTRKRITSGVWKARHGWMGLRLRNAGGK